MRPTLLRTLALVFFLAACDSDPVGLLDLDGSISAAPATAQVGQEVVATIDAQGNFLLSLEVDWGDGSDPTTTSVEGARTARWQPSHTYEAAGAYTLTLRIEETLGSITRTANVVVTAGGGR